MSISIVTFYTTPLQCNCPKCYSASELELNFKQEWKNTIWRKRTTETVREELFCNLCKDFIYPVSWTDDIERLYEYHCKRADREHYSKWKPFAFIVILILMLALGTGIYFLLNR